MMRDQADGIDFLVDIDIKSLASMVDLLLWCYIKTGITSEFPATLERLRRNIAVDAWQRKIIYFFALHALWPDWNEEHGRRELCKLGSIKDETDVEVLKLYIDLFAPQITFSEKQDLIDRILNLSESGVDRLHYRGLRAAEYLVIGDPKKATRELTEAVADFRKSNKRNPTGHQRYQLALSLELLGALLSDDSVLSEATDLYKAILREEDLTLLGRVHVYKCLGDSLRYQSKWEAAAEMYEKALNLQRAPICEVFLSECLLYLGKTERAKELVSEIDPKKLAQGENVDYALIFAAVSIAIGEKEMLNQAQAALKCLDVKAPYFRERRDGMLLAIAETKTSGPSNSLALRAKALLKYVGKSAMHYLILQPNIMGVGLNLGKMVEDWTKGTRKHSPGKAEENKSE